MEFLDIMFNCKKEIDKNIYMLKKINSNTYDALAYIKRNKKENMYYKIMIDENNCIKCLNEKVVKKRSYEIM